MGTTGAVAAGGQAGLSIVGAYNTSQSQKLQAEFQQAQYEANSKIANLQGESAIQAGEFAQADTGRRAKALIGSERAAAGASGVDVNSGSAAAIQGDTAALSAMDQLTIKNNAWKQAWGYSEQALQSEGSGIFTGLAGANQSQNTLLTGGMQAVGYGGQAVYNYNKPIK